MVFASYPLHPISNYSFQQEVVFAAYPLPPISNSLFQQEVVFAAYPLPPISNSLFQQEVVFAAYPLPPNVHLLTLEEHGGSLKQPQILVRLEHFYSANLTSGDLSLPVDVNFNVGNDHSGYCILSNYILSNYILNNYILRCTKHYTTSIYNFIPIHYNIYLTYTPILYSLYYTHPQYAFSTIILSPSPPPPHL